MINVWFQKITIHYPPPPIYYAIIDNTPFTLTFILFVIVRTRDDIKPAVVYSV